MRISGNLPISASVNSGEILIVTVTRLEDVRLVGSRSVVVTADTVIDVLAKISSICTCGVASLEAELASTHEVVPLNDLLKAASEVLGEDEAAHWIPETISTVRVHFSSIIS